MTSFKELIESDVHNVFLNTEEFSDMHVINGKKLACQVDTFEQIEREKRFRNHIDGMYAQELLIYVSSTTYGPIPKRGSLIVLDNKRYTVNDAVEEDGVYSITIEANRA